LPNDDVGDMAFGAAEEPNALSKPPNLLLSDDAAGLPNDDVGGMAFGAVEETNAPESNENDDDVAGAVVDANEKEDGALLPNLEELVCELGSESEVANGSGAQLVVGYCCACGCGDGDGCGDGCGDGRCCGGWIDKSTSCGAGRLRAMAARS
jgi:hypothetical protein